MINFAACKSPSEPEPSSPLSPLSTAAPLTDSPLEAPAQLVALSFDEPLTADATRVTGQGPAGLPIQIVDVTFGAEQIGSGKIEADNTFDIQVASLPEGHRIGIMVSEPFPAEFQTQREALWGKGGIQLPGVGDVFASAMTTKQ